MELAGATWHDVDAAETDIALLPVGSTEQHGPHAPLSTDTLTAEVVARAGADVYEGDAAIAPALPYGVSEEHRDFAGTLWVTPETFRGVVRDVVTSLAAHDIRRIVVVNGHGGNVGPLREVSARLTRHGDVYVVPFTWFEAIGEPAEPMGHAGPLETAMVRRHAPDLVREDRVETARDGASDGWGEWVSGVNLAFDSAEFTENGVVGDPSRGDAELGAELTARAADALGEVLSAVAER